MNSATRFINLMSAARYEAGSESRRYLVRWYPALDSIAASYPGWENIFHSYRNHKDSGSRRLAAVLSKLENAQELTTEEQRWLDKRSRLHRRGKLQPYLRDQAAASSIPNIFVVGSTMAKTIATFKKMVERWNSDREWLRENQNDPLMQKLASAVGIDLGKVEDLNPIKVPSVPRGRPVPALLDLGAAKATPKVSSELPLAAQLQLTRLASTVNECGGNPPGHTSPAYDWLRSIRRKHLNGKLHPAVSAEIVKIGWGQLLLPPTPSPTVGTLEEEESRVCGECERCKPIQSFPTHYILDNGMRRRRKICRACNRKS